MKSKRPSPSKQDKALVAIKLLNALARDSAASLLKHASAEGQTQAGERALKAVHDLAAIKSVLQTLGSTNARSEDDWAGPILLGWFNGFDYDLEVCHPTKIPVGNLAGYTALSATIDPPGVGTATPNTKYVTVHITTPGVGAAVTVTLIDGSGNIVISSFTVIGN